MREAGPAWRPDLAAANAAAWFVLAREFGPMMGGGSLPASLWTAT